MGCIILLFYSCAFQKEKPYVIPEKKVYKIKKPIVPSFDCSEDTRRNFNASGIKVLPFMRTAFHDMNNDGFIDMVAGSKYGTLELYLNSGNPVSKGWKHMQGYFKGVRAKAFSSPAIGDIDLDGRIEIAVGTGGFSRNSGMILFYRNNGSWDKPVWSRIYTPELKVGNDAAVTLVDYTFDDRPDLIAGNSEGRLFFFRNTSSKGIIQFTRERSLLPVHSFQKYAVPSAVRINNMVVLAVGDSIGNLYIFTMKKGDKMMRRKKININLTEKNFISPSFTSLMISGHLDLVLTDADGHLYYFINKGNNLLSWEPFMDMFNRRIHAGPACSPTIAHFKERTYMVVGNIDGTLKLYEKILSKKGLLPWVEKKGYLGGIKVSGFSRGVLTSWEGREVLITGEVNGDIRAFFKYLKGNTHIWKEYEYFFQGIKVKGHSSPAIFDIDGDGRWELVTGSQDGNIYAFKVTKIINGHPVWKRLYGLFENVHVHGFSVPSLAWDGRFLYLVVGQQDGAIRTFIAETQRNNKSLEGITFFEASLLDGIRMVANSTPFVMVKSDDLELISGDYDGNIRHFTCMR
jgi:WD40 repeat protein